MSRVTIVTTGYFPVPASKGGAVENIVENLVKKNEYFEKLDLTIFSCFDSEASDDAKKYRKTKFNYIHIPKIILIFDLIFYKLVSLIKPTDNMSYRYIFQRVYYIFSVAWCLKKHDFGHIVIENHSSLLWVLKLFGNYKKYKGRYSYHLHNEVKELYNCENVFENISFVFGVSEFINKLVDKKYDKFNLYYKVLSNKVDRNSFNIPLPENEKNDLKNKFKIPNNDNVILFSGRLNKEKGIIELLKSFNNLKRDDTTLLIVGSYYFKGNVKTKFEQELQNLSNNKVRFTGFVEYSEIPKLYKLADIVVLPSVWEDPAPLTVIEALTAGRPLITTNSGGIPEYVNDTFSIVLNKEDNLISDLEKSINRLLDDKTLQNQMTLKALEKTSNWTLEEYYYDFVKLFDDEVV